MSLSDDLVDQVIAVVRDHLPLLDHDDLDELRYALAEIGPSAPSSHAPDGVRPVRKYCVSCGWVWPQTTSTHCANCRGRLRGAA